MASLEGLPANAVFKSPKPRLVPEERATARQATSNKHEKRLNLLIATSSRRPLPFGHALSGQIWIDNLRGRNRAAGAGDVRRDAQGRQGRSVHLRYGRQADRPGPAPPG